MWSPFGPALGLLKVKLLLRLEWHDWRRKQYLQTADSHFYFWHHVWMLLAECSESISHNHTAHIKKCPDSIVGETAKASSLLNLIIPHHHGHRHMAFSITISTQWYWPIMNAHTKQQQDSVWNGFYWQSKIRPPICASFGTVMYTTREHGTGYVSCFCVLPCFEIVCIWVPGHVGIRGNLAADSATKDAVIGNIWVELISDLKACTNKYMLELWQSEWDEFPEYQLHQVLPNLKEYCLSLVKQKRRCCDSSIAHGSFFHHTLLFIEGWGTASVHQMWWTFNYRTHFT